MTMSCPQADQHTQEQQADSAPALTQAPVQQQAQESEATIQATPKGKGKGKGKAPPPSAAAGKASGKGKCVQAPQLQQRVARQQMQQMQQPQSMPARRQQTQQAPVMSPQMQQMPLQSQPMPPQRQQMSLRQTRAPCSSFTGGPLQRNSRGGGMGSQLLGDVDVAGFNDDDELEVLAAVAAVEAQAEPEPDTSADGPLSVSTRIEYKALPIGHTQDVFGLVTVQAGAVVASSGGEERQPMDIVGVLDVSGSMMGDKIRQVQDATRFIIDQADPKDRLGLVAFNNTAARVLRLRKMNAEGKNDGNVSTLRLSAGGGTSIASGLDMALSIMEQRRQRNKVSAILLLTDGQDGSTRHQLPALLQRAAQANVAIYAFGFGRDHDAALLSEIAEQARTPFTFVEDTDKIREAFAGAVGGLSSIVAQKVELSIKCQVPLKNVNTPFPLRQSDREATITIPDMFALERRDILVELAVPSDEAGATRMVLLEASARYTDLRRNCIVQTALTTMEAERVEEPQPEAEPDEEVSAQRERVEVSRALQLASNASDLGQFGEAIQMIESCDNRMKTAKSKKTPVREAMIQELDDARSRMRDRQAWEQGGRAEMRDAYQMHQMQRCTNMMQARGTCQKKSKAMYSSPTQLAWIEKSKSNVTQG